MIETLIRDYCADATVWFDDGYRVEHMVKIAKNMAGVMAQRCSSIRNQSGDFFLVYNLSSICGTSHLENTSGH